MGDAIDSSAPAEIYSAIQKVNSTPGESTKLGLKALWWLRNAPNHTLSHDELMARSRGIQLHLGWICQRVAERLGVEEPQEYALCDKSRAPDGKLLLTLKPSVVKAMSIAAPKKPRVK
jgi:hypothetical protein